MNKKSTLATITIISILTLATITMLPIVNAHDPPWTLDTWAYINVTPEPTGVNQPVFVSMWIDKVPPGAQGPWGARWHGMMVEITKPDGTKTSLGPYDSDSVGGAWTQYTPNQVGTYQFDFTFPGQTVTDENPSPFGPGFLTGAAFINDTYRASSASTTLTVQEEPIAREYGAAPLPTGYWERPINSMNREWSSLGGDWLGLRATSFGFTGMYSHAGNFNPYSTAPNTAHVVWTKPIAFGGQIGGEFGTEDLQLYATGTAYEAKFGAVIINGILYYTEYPGAAGNPGELKAVDMRTGEEIWSRQQKSDHHTLKCGMVYNFITGDQYGGHAYLFTANTDTPGFLVNIWEPPVWSMYEAMTGEWILDIANQSAGTLDTGPNGELLSYSNSGGMVSLWNASKCIQEGSWDQVLRVYTPLEVWRPPQGVTIDWNEGIEWSVPAAAPGAVNCISDDILVTTFDLGGPFGTPGGAQTGWRVDTGYNANTGVKLWGPINRTLTAWTSLILNGIAGEGVYLEYNRNELTIIAYSLATGNKLWGPTVPEDNPWGYYDYSHGIVIGYGKAYSFGMGGAVYCYDIETGERLWKWNAGNAGLDTPYGVWPLGTWGNHHILADGKLYVRSGHDYTPPVWKGAELYCIDAETGEKIWSSLSFDIVGSPAIADGYMIWMNGYDNQVYCYNKGPSATTVTAPDLGVPQGTSIMIRGMVTDESPGTKNTLLTARFPNGVPAVSDESQSGWMEYLYQQQLFPTDAVGVDVTIDVIDANGNFRNIGTATSDTSGFYSMEWMPDIPGKYTVIATFAGSEAQYASYAETAFVVDEAPEPTATPDPTPAPMTDTYVLGMGAAAIAAIVVIGLLILMMLRKK